MSMEVAVFYNDEDKTTLVSVAEEDVPESSVYHKFFDSFLEALQEASRFANLYRANIVITKKAVPNFSCFIGRCVAEKEQNIYKASCGEMVFIED